MIEIRKGKIPTTRRSSAQKQPIVVAKGSYLIIVGRDVNVVY